MKKRIFIAISLAVALMLSGPRLRAAETGEGRPLRPVTIAVFSFEDSGGKAAGVGRAVADMLVTRLGGSRLFRIYERSRLEEIFREQRRNSDTGEDPHVTAARTLGVQFVIMGKVSEFGISNNSVLIPEQGTVTKYKARAALDVRAVLVADGRVLETWETDGAKSSYNLGVNIYGIPNFSFTGREFDQSLLGQATREAVNEAADFINQAFSGEKMQKLAREFRIRGLVADAGAGEIIINIGSEAGVEEGMILDVYRLQKEITDPETGKKLTERLAPVGAIRVYRAKSDFAMADVIDRNEGAAIKVDDRVWERRPGEEPPPGDIVYE